MILTKPPSTPECARDLAVCTQYLHGPTPLQDVLAAVQAAAGNPARGLFSPRSASQPAFVLADAGSWSYLFMEGCSSLTMGTLVLDGYKGSVLDSTTVPTSSYYRDVTDNVLAAALANNLLGQINVMCVGHSLGGAVASIVAGRIHETSRTAHVNYCTFGAPKPSNWSSLAPVNQCVGARWFAAEDPVPLLMPSSADNLAMLLAFPIYANMRFSNFSQPFGGLELSSIGNITGASFPSLASIDTITNIAAWLYSLDTQAGQAHALQGYISRLTAKITNHPDQADTNLPTDHTILDPETTRRELTGNQRVALARLQEQEARQHARPVVIPDQFRAQVVRVGRVWNVVVGGNVVAMSARERTARSAARRYNAWVDSLLTQGIVDPVSFNAAVQAYFQAAADPASEISPKLQEKLGT